MAPADVAERAVRWAPGIGAVMVAVVTVLVGAVVVFDLSLDRVSVDGLAEDGAQLDRSGGEGGTVADDDGSQDDGTSEPSRLSSTVHVLVAGSDDRSHLSDDERRELSTGHAEGERTEALAIVRVDPGRDHVDVLRLPRDLLVTRCDGTRGRINAAYAIGERNGTGGASCLVETITAWTDIPIHHVVKIDFRGFVDVVDTVGGVELAFDEPLEDERAGLDVPAGCVRLDGADALAFVRARHLDDDFGRIGRQQELVAATMDQVLTSSTITDPRRLGRLLTTTQRSVQMDDGLSPRRLRSIAATVARAGGDDLVTRTVTGEIRLSDDGIAFLHPHDDYASLLFEAFAAGDLVLSPEGASEVDDGLSRRSLDQRDGGAELSEPGTAGGRSVEIGPEGGAAGRTGSADGIERSGPSRGPDAGSADDVGDADGEGEAGAGEDAGQGATSTSAVC